MNITARASHISHSPRKVNLVAQTIVGLPAQKALERLQFTLKRASDPVAKVLKQAIGNAVSNYRLDAKNLFVEQAFATKGRTLKRGLFGGRAKYKPFERVASHLTITLKSTTPKTAVSKKEIKAAPVETEKKSAVKKVKTTKK